MSIFMYYLKHGNQIAALLAKGNTPEGTHLVLDLLNALVPVVKKNWPHLNENGLVDDTLSMLQNQLTPQVDVSKLS